MKYLTWISWLASAKIVCHLDPLLSRHQTNTVFYGASILRSIVTLVVTSARTTFSAQLLGVWEFHGKRPMNNKTIAYYFDRIHAKLGYKFPRLGSFAMRTFYKFMPRNIEVEIVQGVKIIADFSDLTFRATYWQGSRYEHPTSWQLIKWLENEPNPIFFDIGANYGFFSYLVLSSVPDCSVFAFEPNPFNFNRQITAKERNHLDTFHSFNLGLSDKVADLVLHHGIEDLGHSTFARHPGLTNTPNTTIRVFPFDTWLEKFNPNIKNPKGWVAKIDVEGFELKVLKGMSKSLSNQSFKGLIVEINPFTLSLTGVEGEDVFNLMHKYGYQSINVVPNCVSSFVGNAFFEIK